MLHARPAISPGPNDVGTRDTVRGKFLLWLAYHAGETRQLVAFCCM
jgi:hypothetical protein